MNGRYGNRKIAANYIYCPGSPLVKNGYVELCPDGVKVVDTGGRIREMAGLEFYGGLIVPGYVAECAARFVDGEALLPLLDECFVSRKDCPYSRVAVIEGADLRSLSWTRSAAVHLL